MLERITKGDPEAICTIIAFVVAASIFVAVAWRALRMKSRQVDQLSQLPFATATPPASHDTTERSHSS